MSPNSERTARNLTQALRYAATEDKAEIYAGLNLQLTYNPGGRTVNVRAGVGQTCTKESCPRTDTTHWPHIALSTTVLNSAYRNTASLSTRTATELRELLIPGGREWWFPDCSSSSADVAGLREVCYRAKAAAFQVA
jgi:hypothetical protein